MSGSGKIRIVAGKWRNRKIDVLNLPSLRPTPDRIRETLFNWIQEDIIGARCLDLFAGTGALGFESLSRNAAEVVMIDSNATVVKSLRQHATLFKSENHLIQLADGLLWLASTTKPFDIIFLDPPFGQGYIEKCCDLIIQRSLLKKSGLLYIESETELVLPKGWQIKKQKKAGQVNAMLVTQGGLIRV